MNSERRKCNCGGTRFAEIKMGGSPFNLQWKSKRIFSIFSGFFPDAWACKDCGTIHFAIPESQETALEDSATKPCLKKPEGNNEGSGINPLSGTIVTLLFMLVFCVVILTLIWRVF